MRQRINIVNQLSTPTASSGGFYSTELPKGYTYHGLQIDLGDNTSYAFINLIQVKINSVVVQQYSSFADLMVDNVALGGDTSGNVRYANIYFDRRNIQPLSRQADTAVYTGRRQSVTDKLTGQELYNTGSEVEQFSINIGYSASLTTTPAIVTTAVVSTDVNPPLIRKRLNYQVDAYNTTGQINIRPFQALNPNDVVTWMRLDATSAQLTSAQLFSQRVSLFNMTYEQSNYQLLQDAYINPTTNNFFFAASTLGEADDVLPLVDTNGRRIDDIYFQLQMAAAMQSINVNTETLGVI